MREFLGNVPQNLNKSLGPSVFSRVQNNTIENGLVV